LVVNDPVGRVIRVRESEESVGSSESCVRIETMLVVSTHFDL